MSVYFGVGFVFLFYILVNFFEEFFFGIFIEVGFVLFFVMWINIIFEEVEVVVIEGLVG